MEDLFPILVVIFFLIAPLLERVLKGGKQQQPPPPRQQQPAPRPYQRRSETMDDEEEAGEGSAAEMLPDDLWAILTGETRPPRTEPTTLPPPAPRPAPERPMPQRSAPQRPERSAPSPRPTARRPAPAPPPVSARRPAPASMEAAADEEIAGYRPLPPPERFERVEYAPQDYVREVPRHEPPVIVSMETPLESDEVRHGRFHDRLSRLAAPETVQRGPARRRVGLHTADELRHAIILREILGPPKGLE